MGSLRIGWIAAWGGTAFGALVVASPVLNEDLPFWVAGASLAIGLAGYWLMRWRRTGFDTGEGEPNLGTGGKYRLSLKYELEWTEGGFTCRVKHPQRVGVMGATLYRRESSRLNIVDAWTPEPKGELRTKPTRATFTMFSPRPKEGDLLVFHLEADEDFRRSEIKFYRRE